MNRIEIFDIDGCICESFFPNIGEKADIKSLKENILKTPLDLGFIRYFRKISIVPGVRSFFITGRRAKDFQEETFKQLDPLNLNKNQLIFFPDHYSHTKIRYNTFKIFQILSIAVKNREFVINVYDDLDSYFNKLWSIALKLRLQKLQIELVKNPKEFWNLRLIEVSRINAKCK